MRPLLLKLDDLPAADRAALWRRLISVAADSRRAGWEPFELQDPIYATGRSFGVKLTAAEIAALIAA